MKTLFFCTIDDFHLRKPSTFLLLDNERNLQVEINPKSAAAIFVCFTCRRGIRSQRQQLTVKIMLGGRKADASVVVIMKSRLLPATLRLQWESDHKS
jgi:hypothetical protein